MCYFFHNYMYKKLKENTFQTDIRQCMCCKQTEIYDRYFGGTWFEVEPESFNEVKYEA